MVRFRTIFCRFFLRLLLILTGVVPFLPGCPILSAQTPDNDRAIISHYAASESIPDALVDCIFDKQGRLWLVPENDNIRMFDGIVVIALPGPAAKDKLQFEFSSVMQDGAGSLHFLSRNRDLLFRVNPRGQLYFDSISTKSNLPGYKSYHYFQWSDPVLQKRLSQNKSFIPFDDSTFVFNEKDSFFLYRDHRLQRLEDINFDTRNAFLLDQELLVLNTNKFIRIDRATGKKQDMDLLGDILTDSLYLTTAKGPLTLLRSVHPHILFNNRLYRIRIRNDKSVETTFICDLGFVHRELTKVEYNPQMEVTAISTNGEGVYLVRANPFFPNQLSKSFLELNKQRIYYPITLKDSVTFFLSWCEFSGSGYYKLLDRNHKGPRCLFTDHSGNIWEGTENKVLLYRKDSVKPHEFTVESKDTRVVDICEDERHDILCLTKNTLCIFDGIKFSDLKPAFSCPHDQLVFQKFVYMGHGKYWIGASGGLYTYDRQLNRIDRVEAIPKVYTINITKLSDGAVLMSCYPMGYYFIYYKGRFHKITIDIDLTIKQIVSIMEDRRGRIWFATANGLLVTSKEEIEAYCEGKRPFVYYYKYGKKDGLQEVEFNGGLNLSNCTSRDGYLSFNSMSGVLTFHQDTARQVFPNKNIQLCIVGPSEEVDPIGDSVELKHENNGAIVLVSVPYYGSKDNLLLEYKFGAGNDWHNVNSLNRISIGHLSYGAYPLRLRVRTGLGPEDYLTKNTTIWVRPLFRESLLFKVTIAILIALICIVVAIAIYRLRKEVRMRNITLRDKNEELQDALSELEDNVSLKEKLISLILHDLKTPLYFQSLLFSQIVEGDYFSNPEGRELFRELKNSSAGILRFTKEFLTWYSSQRDGFKVKKTVFDPMLIVEDLFVVYKDIAAKKNVTLQCDAGSMTSLFTDRNILEIVIRNLLDNALKYTGAAGSVTLIFERRPDVDAIMVADTGKGMTKDKIKMLEGHSNMTHRQSSETFGYRFIFTMARKIDAGIHITSSPGKGTSVTILIPHQVAEDLSVHPDIFPI